MSKVCIRCMGAMLSPGHLYVLERLSCHNSTAGWGTPSSYHSLLGLSHDNPDLVFHWDCHMIIQI